MKKKLLSILMIFTLILTGCGTSEQSKEETVTLNIAYQYGLAYAPLIIAEQQQLIEKAYKDATGKELTVVWNQMNSGADINTGITSGSLDVGFLGVAPAITGITKNVGYKIFTNLSGQEHVFMTNNSSLTSFEDFIGSSNQIAVVNVGSIQHIILAKALNDNGYDPHALDSNLAVMKHPDGMTALESGNVAGHVTSSPYIYMERANDSLFEITEVNSCWPKENSFIVGVASESLHDNNKEAYDALCKGVSDAIDYLNENQEETAKLTCEYDGNTPEDELEYIKKGNYSIETKGLFELSSFMADAEFIDTKPESIDELVFDNVTGD